MQAPALHWTGGDKTISKHCFWHYIESLHGIVQTPSHGPFCTPERFASMRPERTALDLLVREDRNGVHVEQRVHGLPGDQVVDAIHLCGRHTHCAGTRGTTSTRLIVGS